MTKEIERINEQNKKLLEENAVLQKKSYGGSRRSIPEKNIAPTTSGNMPVTSADPSQNKSFANGTRQQCLSCKRKENIPHMRGDTPPQCLALYARA